MTKLKLVYTIDNRDNKYTKWRKYQDLCQKLYTAITNGDAILIDCEVYTKIKLGEEK